MQGARAMWLGMTSVKSPGTCSQWFSGSSYMAEVQYIVHTSSQMCRTSLKGMNRSINERTYCCFTIFDIFRCPGTHYSATLDLSAVQDPLTCNCVTRATKLHNLQSLPVSSWIWALIFANANSDVRVGGWWYHEEFPFACNHGKQGKYRLQSYKEKGHTLS